MVEMLKKGANSVEKKPTTMRDVARHAGVSLATVSRALDGSSLVSKETSLLVQRAVESLDFVPNISARTLKYGQSQALGVIIPDLTNPFFSEFLREFGILAAASGQVILLANAEAGASGAQNSVRQMLMRRVDGVVVMPSFDELDPYQQLSLRKIPTVAIDSRRTGPYFSDVSIQHEEGMLQAVLYLKALGHHRIAFIAGQEGIFISSLRLDAFRNAMRQHALVVKNEYIRTGNYRIDAGDREMRSLLSLPERPTAVITINDMTAMGALRAAREMSVSVPEELSVIGFDGIALDEVVYPALSTMSVSRLQLARNCHTALEELKVSPINGKQFRVPVELICRQSTGPAISVKGKGGRK